MLRKNRPRGREEEEEEEEGEEGETNHTEHKDGARQSAGEKV